MEKKPDHQEIRHGRRIVNGVSLHYAECGDPTRPLMLFIHGFPEAWFAWRAQMGYFSDRYHVVAVDTRGINESDKPGEVAAYRIKPLVKDIVALIEALGHDNCILVGHDWGGAIACAVALGAPHRVRRLVLINAVHPVLFARQLLRNPAQQAASQYMLDFRSENFADTVQRDDFAYLTAMFSTDGRRPDWLDDTALAEYRAAWSRAGAVASGLNYYKATTLYPGNEAQLAEVADANVDAFVLRMPTLVLWGMQDRYLLAGCLDGLAQFAPEMQLRTYDDASHWIVHEMPERINSMIENFALGAKAGE
jgi:pimeloyl-ACP methyl ester carboxylesterase